MNRCPDSLWLAIQKHMAKRLHRCSVARAAESSARKRKALSAAHAEDCHAWNCLRYAVETGLQPVTAGWEALQAGFIPEGWELPRTFPGSARGAL